MATEQREALSRRNADEYAELKAVVARLRAEGRVEEPFSGEARDRCVRDVFLASSPASPRGLVDGITEALLASSEHVAHTSLGVSAASPDTR